jgi:aminobenzoyl-glutamate utilization protein B
MEARLAARGAWAALRPDLEKAFDSFWHMPELAGMETRSAEALCGWLEAHGFAITRGAGGIPTAFVARKGSGTGPRIAILAEYDALPGLGNDVSSNRAPTGQVAGHGCGHNHIGPANTAAAIAVASLNLAGEIAVIGCPAEEILWGKVALLKQGVFDGFDAILTSHGDYQNGAASRPCQAMVTTEYVFLGEAGHGGKAGPRNALSAAEDAVRAINEAMVQSCPGVSVKHVLRIAGIMPSITPDETRLWITCRNVELEEVRRAHGLITEACRSAAANANCGFREQFISECRGYLANDALAHVLQGCLEELGPPRWSEDEITFMRDLSAAASPGEVFTLDQGLKLYDEDADYYGQDDGEVSWRIPLGRVNWAYPEQVPIHHWAWTALSGHKAGHRGALMASEALAMAAAQLLAEPSVIGIAKTELASRTRNRDIDMPRLGAWNTMTKAPATFWDASWNEVTP